jgi:hypothetical protein
VSSELSNVNTVACPSWWSGATTILIKQTGLEYEYTLPVADVELLPQGVSFPLTTDDGPNVFLPWWNIDSVQQAS